MRAIKLLLLCVLLLPSITKAIQLESAIFSLKKEFPHLTQFNTTGCASFASNGKSSFKASGIIYPESEADLYAVISFFNELRKKNSHIRPMVISAGSRHINDEVKTGWSFDCHAQGHDGDIVLNTSKLKGLYQDIDWSTNFDREKGVVKAWIYAGTPWSELLNVVNKSYVKHTGDKNNYFVPIVAPTGSQITIGGSFASNTHARGTSVMGGYFADIIDAFTMITVVNGSPSKIYVDKEQHPDLFYALIGSFGRGGIVAGIKINLQLVSRDKVATTKVKKVYSIDEMTAAFSADRERMIADAHSDDPSTERNAFLASVGLISQDFATFFMMENDLEKPTACKSSFPLFGAPSCCAGFIYQISRTLPKFSDWAASKYLDLCCAKTPCEFFSGRVSGVGEFHNQPLNNYIFFQDIFAINITENEPKNFQTAHLTLMMRLENLGRAMKEIKRIKELPEFKDITFELQDLLLLPSTQVLMAPGYSKASNDALFIAYTISWAIDDDTREKSRKLEATLEQRLYDLKIKGDPLAWLHPLKEFSFKNGPIEFYAESAQKLEEILQKYGIEDRPLFYSRIHDYLYSQGVSKN